AAQIAAKGGPLLLLATCRLPEVIGGQPRELPERSLVMHGRDHSVIPIETLPQIVTIRPESDPLVKAVTLGKERLPPVVVSVVSVGVEGDHWKPWLRTIDAGINRATPVTERQ